MKRQWSFFTIVLLLVSSVHAFNILMDGYTLESYAQYSSATSLYGMVFDDSGNLYINHFDDGKIQKIDGTRQVSTLVAGLGKLVDMVWGGGTAYGNYLYSTSTTAIPSDNKVFRIDLNGNAQSAPMTLPNHSPCAINIDRTGNYNNQMYVGTAGMDRIVSVSTTGSVTLFTNWPGQHGGGVYGLAFDTTGKYGGRMYVGNTYPADPGISGLFAVNPDGSTYRFCEGLAQAGTLSIDTVGSYFGGDMFVYGYDSIGADMSIWRVYADGTCDEFMTDVRSFTFGADGAMYVSSYDWTGDEVTIARVVPEPATMFLLGLGGLTLLRKRK